MLKGTEDEAPVSSEDLRSLRPFAAGTRYPFAAEPATHEGRERAVALAERVVASAEERIREEWMAPGA